MNFRKGDTVSLRGTVKHDFSPDGKDGDKRVFVDLIGTHETVWIKPEDLTLVGQMFEVGDSVRWQNAGEELFLYGVILAISDGHAWIDYGQGEYCTRMLTSVERVQIDGDTE
jgi:hypothetical protein